MKQIKLTQGKFALVDDEDYEELNKYKWHAQWGPCNKAYYAKRAGGFLMHREIIKMHGNLNKGELVDHKNHDTLDNRKENLRVCDKSQNQMNKPISKRNRTGIKGVYLHKIKYKDKEYQYWKSSVRAYGKTYFLGNFKTGEEAGRAYQEAVKIYHGEFAFNEAIK